jgi:LysR family hydrogen peroxide-inducible transcriptional activator
LIEEIEKIYTKSVSGPSSGEGLPRPSSDVAGLRAFVAVARLGAVGRAAVALGRTQPSISARVADLESTWRTRLFRRAARGMELTPEGARLLPLAEAVLRDLEELDRTAGIPVRPSSEIRLGAGDALGRRRLPRALASLLRESPALEVSIREGPAPRLLEALRGGEIDVALVVHPPARRPEEGLDVELLLESEVRVLAPRGVLGEGRRALPLRALARHRLIVLQPGSGFRRHLERAFVRAGQPFRPAVEVGNLSLVRRFVATGLGVAPVPAVAFGGRDTPGLEWRRLAGVEPVRYDRAVRAVVPLPAAPLRLLEFLPEAPGT